MTTYNINMDNGVLKVGFGTPAQNDEIVVDATKRLNEMIASAEITGGEVIRINGAASLPVAMAVGHRLAHLYQCVACWDPKLSKYVVAIAHGPKYQVGELLD